MIIWGSTTIWYNTWGMRFNVTKCNIMRVSWTHDTKLFNYSLTGQVLEEVMDAKYLGVTLSNDLEWSKHIATMTNKLTPSFCFRVATWRASQTNLSKLLTFLWFALLWNMAPLFRTHTINTTVTKLRGCSVECNVRQN